MTGPARLPRERLRETICDPSEAERARMWRGIAARMAGRRRRQRLLAGALYGALAIAAAAGAGLLLVRGQAARPEAIVVRASGAVRVADAGRSVSMKAGQAWPLPLEVLAEAGASAEWRIPRGLSVRWYEASALTLSGGELDLERGAVDVRVEPQDARFVVRLGRYRVVVVGTRFLAAHNGAEASVCLYQGAVEITGPAGRIAALDPGQGWRSSVRAPPFPRESTCAAQQAAALARRTSPPGDRPIAPMADLAGTGQEGPRVVAEVKPTPRPRARSRTPVLEVLTAVLAEPPALPVPPPAPTVSAAAPAPGLAAENALYTEGASRLAAGDGAGAISIWTMYRRRFPDGVLRHEVDLALLEASVRLRDDAAALVEAEAFLARHPRSPRASEVHAIRGTIHENRGDCARARADYERAASGPLPPPLAERVREGLARCRP